MISKFYSKITSTWVYEPTMSNRSRIEWTTRTWNPFEGCAHVSPGCAGCYAAREALALNGPGQKYEGLVQVAKGVPYWSGKFLINESEYTRPFRWGQPQRVFVNSRSDTFFEDAPFEAIARIFAIMGSLPQHTFQVLTKRPERMTAFFDWLGPDPLETLRTQKVLNHRKEVLTLVNATWPFANVWLGVTVENQKAAEQRVPALLHAPAITRFVSCEPLLEPVDLSVISGTLNAYQGANKLGWVIVGGESGPNARPMDETWVRTFKNHCVQYSVPFFYKQRVDDGTKIGLPVLDGQIWDQYPHHGNLVGSTDDVQCVQQELAQGDTLRPYGNLSSKCCRK